MNTRALGRILGRLFLFLLCSGFCLLMVWIASWADGHPFGHERRVTALVMGMLLAICLDDDGPRRR